MTLLHMKNKGLLRRFVLRNDGFWLFRNSIIACVFK